MARNQLPDGSDITIAYEAHGFDGRPGVTVAFEDMGLTLHFTLEDAESLAEAIVQVVRKAEELHAR